MAEYAARTKISPEKTRLDIEELMKRRGADQFFSGSDSERAILAFRLGGRHIRFLLPFAGCRSDQHLRSRWRALFIVIKAKAEAIDIGILTTEEAFLTETILPDRRTVGEIMLPQVESAYQDGTMPPLLPHYG